MTHTKRLSLLSLLASLALACTARPSTTPVDDATIDAHMTSDGPRTFTLSVVNDDLEVALGERVTLDVRIDRQGDFDEPVLIELAGLPDPLRSQARESRPGDGVTSLVIVSDVDGEPIERTPFVVQATSLEGLRQTAPVHITVR